MTYKITLPFPPSVNALYGGGSGQKRFASKKYVHWLNIVPAIEPLKKERVDITYCLYFPDKRVRDSMNFLKCVDDYMVKCQFIIDDSWEYIKKQTIIPMGIDKKNPRIEIFIVDI